MEEEKFLVPRKVEPRRSRTIVPVNFDLLDVLQQHYKTIGVELFDEVGVSEPCTTYASVNNPLDSFKPNQITKTTANVLKHFSDNLPLNGTHGCYTELKCNPAEVVTEDVLGKGSFGEVVRTKNTRTTETFVTKTMRKETFNTNEVTLPVQLEHEHVVKVLGLIQRDTAQGLLLDILLEDAGMSLYSYVKSVGPLCEMETSGYLMQILEGLCYIHNKGVIHQDIKPENICLLKREGGLQSVLKIADFGTCKMFEEIVQFKGVTPEYMPPEMTQLYLKWANITDRHITGKADVYAVALVAMFMYKGYHILVKLITHGKTSYKGFEKNRIKECQMNLIFWTASDPGMIKLLIPDDLSSEMKNLLDQMTRPLPDRLDAQSALLEMKGFQSEQASLCSKNIQLNTADTRDKRRTNAVLQKSFAEKSMEIGYADKTGEPSWATPITGQAQTMRTYGACIHTQAERSHIPATRTTPIQYVLQTENEQTVDDAASKEERLGDDTDGNQGNIPIFGNLPNFGILDI